MNFIVKAIRYADPPNLTRQRRVYELVWKVYQRFKVQEQRNIAVENFTGKGEIRSIKTP